MVTFQSDDSSVWDYPDESGIKRVVIPVNLAGAMGAGLAKDCARRYPNVERAYKSMCATKQLSELKRTRLVHFNGGLVILAATKNHWSRPSQLGWIDRCLFEIAQYSQQGLGGPVCVPALGCGLGGLEWDLVKDMIVDRLDVEKTKFLVFPPH